MTSLNDCPVKSTPQSYERFVKQLTKELLSELSPKINPAYDGWGTLEDDAKVKVYLRVLGLTKTEAWKLIKAEGKK